MVKEIEKKIDESATPPIEVKPKRISKKMLLIIINGVLILGIAGGAGWYFNRVDNHAEKNEKKPSKSSPSAEPKFVPLEPFTVNLQREAADQFLQIGITLKILQPELEEKIKKNLPEIRSRLLVLLSGKLPSELTSSKGKKILANEIIAETEIVLGLRTAPTLPNSIIHASAKTGAASSVVAASSAKTGAASSVVVASSAKAGAASSVVVASSTKAGAASSLAAASQVEATSSEETSATEEGTSTKPNSEEDASVIEVLFTSFIIQ